MGSDTRKRTAGAFDVRLVIALLTGVYGLVITILGIGFVSDEDLAKADGMNINLLAGIGMLVFTGLFLLWVKLRPLTVPVPEDEENDSSQAGQD
ncbi:MULTISPECIES: hypothetical protein [Prauserella salsuginis group]|uniref:ABC-type nickel/cobalt efflux system permease component RcnA n=2 Tax=Prauserella salsuginis group TaxID=2893672 RepID=A0A839XQD6_9PSEU|nr:MULTISPECIES: hypothetical protein [Prauserella salsuginis group]MBB3664149.1 ABC-type nickel/cobalt efflux system permease component RcnA [Prauserella sediminis]MCR3721602.1 hypothetical protein [Prauserella flava]MCR3734294.1 hypothetical protein [Prauserella salsuginis]